MEKLVMIKGGGDLATGIAHRLYCKGFKVFITEISQPTVVRRNVAFAQAIYSGKCVVEGIEAVKSDIYDVFSVISNGKIPVIIDEIGKCVKIFQPWSLVDAIVAKKNIGTNLNDASIVIGLGPGFQAGIDVHVVIETMRGHNLGKIIMKGSAKPNTGIPGDIGGYTIERLLRSPCDGVFNGLKNIGDVVRKGQIVAYVGSQPIIAEINGVLKGIINSNNKVYKKMKIGDIDPNCTKEQCSIISDKARIIGENVFKVLCSKKR